MEKGSLKRHFFIAVNLPDHVKKQIDEQVNQHRDVDGHKDWSWRPSDEYHISLAFPGALDEFEVLRLKSALEALEHEAFDVSLSGLKFFLRHNDPKRRDDNQHVVWMSVDHQGENDLRSLHHKIVGLLKQAGFHYGRNDITPHVTIVKAPMASVDDVKAFAQRHASDETDTWSCDYVSVYETMMPGQDSADDQSERYKEVARYPLRSNQP